MHVGINPITNSSQRTQQNQYSFEAYKHVLQPEDLKFLEKQAKEFKLALYSPEAVVDNLSAKKVQLSEENKNTFKKLAQGYLFVGDEFRAMKAAAEFRFSALVKLTETYMKKAEPLSGKIIQSIWELAGATHGLTQNQKTIQALQEENAQFSEAITNALNYLIDQGI